MSCDFGIFNNVHVLVQIMYAFWRQEPALQSDGF